MPTQTEPPLSGHLRIQASFLFFFFGGGLSLLSYVTIQFIFSPEAE